MVKEHRQHTYTINRLKLLTASQAEPDYNHKLAILNKNYTYTGPIHELIT